MKFEELTAVLKQEFPEEAINLAESLVLVKEIINDVMNAINHQMSKAYIDRNFDKSRAYMNMAEKFHQFEIKLEDIINEFEVDNVDFMVPVENEGDDTTNKANSAWHCSLMNKEPRFLIRFTLLIIRQRKQETCNIFVPACHVTDTPSDNV